MIMYNIVLFMFACICLCLAVIIMYDNKATFAMRIVSFMVILAVFMLIGVIIFDSVI